MRDFIEVFVILAFMIICILALTTGVDIGECQRFEKVLNYKTEWHFLQGCTIYKPNGEIIKVREK